MILIRWLLTPDMTDAGWKKKENHRFGYENIPAALAE